MVRDDAPARVAGEGVLGLADVAQADLHDASDLGDAVATLYMIDACDQVKPS